MDFVRKLKQKRDLAQKKKLKRKRFWNFRTERFLIDLRTSALAKSTTEKQKLISYRVTYQFKGWIVCVLVNQSGTHNNKCIKFAMELHCCTQVYIHAIAQCRTYFINLKCSLKSMAMFTTEYWHKNLLQCCLASKTTATSLTQTAYQLLLTSDAPMSRYCHRVSQMDDS